MRSVNSPRPPTSHHLGPWQGRRPQSHLAPTACRTAPDGPNCATCAGQIPARIRPVFSLEGRGVQRNRKEATMAPERTIDYLLIGGGLASATSAEEIRKRDPRGSILIVGNDPRLPYHRPPLSKEYLRGEIGAEGVYGNGGVYVQRPRWYEEQRVEPRHAEATALDTRAKTVQLADGHTLGYGSLLLATGGRPRRLDIPGMHLPGVHVLRTLADADALRGELAEPGRQVVIIGSGFIGLEV